MDFLGSKSESLAQNPSDFFKNQDEWMRQNEGISRVNSIVEHERQYYPVEVTDSRTGEVFLVRGQRRGTGEAASGSLWELETRTSGGRTEARLSNPGTIRANSSVDSGLVIENLWTWFSPAMNGWLYIKVDLDDDDELRAELMYDNEIPSWPELWETEEIEDGYHEFLAHYYPLWTFYAKEDAISSGIKGPAIGKDLTAIKYAENANFQCYNVRWESAGGVCNVIQLLSSYRGVLP